MRMGCCGQCQKTNRELVAIYEPQKELVEQYVKQYHLEAVPTYGDLEKMLSEQKPDAVLIYTTIADHRKFIDAAAKHGNQFYGRKAAVHDGRRCDRDSESCARASRAGARQLLYDLQGSWRQMYDEAGKGKLGDPRRIVTHAGHEGPKEIGVGPEWLPWLTDPAQNGAGALFDFVATAQTSLRC